MFDVKKAIWIDENEFDYISFGSDQAYVDFPVRFPTVTIQLESTNTLDKLVDSIRVEAGHKPMFPDNHNELSDDEWDCNGWYDFYIALNGFTDTMVDNSIEAIVVSEDADDNEQSYYISLTEAEQTAMYNELNRQLKERFDTSCDELLEEARQEMIEMEEYRAKHKKVI